MSSPFPIGIFGPKVTERPFADAGVIAPVIERIFGKTGVQVIQEGTGASRALSGTRGSVPLPVPATPSDGKLGQIYDYGGGRYAIRSGPSGEGLATLNERLTAAEARLRAMPVSARLRATKKIFTAWFHEHAQHIRHTRLDTGPALPLYHRMEHVVQGGDIFEAFQRQGEATLRAAQQAAFGSVLSRPTLRPASDLASAISGKAIRYDPSLLATTTAGESLGTALRSVYETQLVARGVRHGRLTENQYTWGTGVKQYEISHAGAVVAKAKLGNPRLILPTAGYEYFGTLFPDLTRSVHSHRSLQAIPELALAEARERDLARSAYSQIHSNAMEIYRGASPDRGPMWESAATEAHRRAVQASNRKLGSVLPTVVETAEWGDVVQAQANAFAKDSYGPLGGRVRLGRMRTSEVLKVGALVPRAGLSEGEQTLAHKVSAAIFGDAGLIGGSERFLAMANANSSRTIQIPMVRIKGVNPQVRLNPAVLDLVNRLGKGKHVDPTAFAGMDFAGLQGQIASGMGVDLASTGAIYGLKPGEKIVSASITGSSIRFELARAEAQGLEFRSGSRVSFLSNQRKYSVTGFVGSQTSKFADLYARGGGGFQDTADIMLQTVANLATESKGRGGLEVVARHLGQTLKSPSALQIVETEGRLSLRLPGDHHLRHSANYMDPKRTMEALQGAMQELGVAPRTFSTKGIAAGLAELASQVRGVHITPELVNRLFEVQERYVNVGARAGMARVGQPSVHLRLMNLRGAAQRLVFASKDSPDKAGKVYNNLLRRYGKMMRSKLAGARRPWTAYAQATLDVMSGNVGKRKKALYDVMNLSEARRTFRGSLPEDPFFLSDPKRLRGTPFDRKRPLVIVVDEAARLAGGENNMRLPFSRRADTRGIKTKAFVMPTGEQLGFGSNVQFAIDLNAPPGTPGRSAQGAAVDLYEAMMRSQDAEHLFRAAGASHIASTEQMLGKTGALRRASYYPTMGNAYLQIGTYGGIGVGEAGFVPSLLLRMGFSERQVMEMASGKAEYFVPNIVREPALDTFHQSPYKIKVLSPEDLKAMRILGDKVQANYDDIVALHPAANPAMNADLDGDAAMVSMWAERGNAKEFAIEQRALREMYNSPGERALREAMGERGLDDLVEEARKVQKPGADAMALLEQQARAKLDRLGPIPDDQFEKMLGVEMMARAQAVKQAPQELTAAANVRWRDATRLGQDVLRSESHDDLWRLVSKDVRGSRPVEESLQFLGKNKKLAVVLEHFYKNRINVGALKKGRTVELLGQTVDDVTFDAFAHSVYQRLGTEARGTDAFTKLRGTMADIIYHDMTTSQGQGGWSLASALAGRGAREADVRALADQAAEFAAHMAYIRYGVSDGARVAARSADSIVFGQDKARIMGRKDFLERLAAHTDETFEAIDQSRIVSAEHFRGGAVTPAEAHVPTTAVTAEARGIGRALHGIPDSVARVLDGLQAGFQKIASNKWGKIALAAGAAVSAAMLLAPSTPEEPIEYTGGGSPMPPPPMMGRGSAPMYSPDGFETESVARVARPMQMRTHYQIRSEGYSGQAFARVGEEAYTGRQGAILQEGVIHDESSRPMYDHQVRNHVRRLNNSRFVG